MRVDKRWWLVALLSVLVGLFFAFDLGQYLNLASIKNHQAGLEAWRAGHRAGRARIACLDCDWSLNAAR